MIWWKKAFIQLHVCLTQPQVIPKDNPDRLSTPTPEPSPRLGLREQRSASSSRGRRIYPRRNSDISLSTITEEPTQYSSHEIIVQPEVVVETTTVPSGATTGGGDGGGDGGGGGGGEDAVSSSSCESSRNVSDRTGKMQPSFVRMCVCEYGLACQVVLVDSYHRRFRTSVVCPMCLCDMLNECC